MKIEYVGGQRQTKLVHELSPLEAAIERYAEKAKAYFLQEQRQDQTQTQVERGKKLNVALKHLEHERRLAEVIVTVQAQLEAYRAFGREQKGSVGRATLGAEAHHPAETLGKYLQADGRPKPREPVKKLGRIVAGKSTGRHLLYFQLLHLWRSR